MEKLGYKHYKVQINTFNITKEKSIRLKEFIKQHPNIIYNDKVLGGYDIEIEVQIENEEKLRNFIQEIRKGFSEIIKDYEILHYYKEYRLRFYPFY